MRILVTGSREIEAKHWPILETALRKVTGDDPGPHTLVHGGAAGADSLFGSIAHSLGWAVESHPADWDAPCRDTCKPGHRRENQYGTGSICPAAGHYRNQAMVDLGADIAVAAYKRGAGNRGTSDCVRRIRAAGILVERVVM